MKKNAKGFTMAEVLIVAAIIAVLVAVSIPIFTKQLERSREETDISNLRSAYAIAATDVLTGDYKNDPYENDVNRRVAYYDPSVGKLVKRNAALSGYGKGTSQHGGADTKGLPFTYGEDTEAEDKVVEVWIETGGPELNVGVQFVKPNASGGAGSPASGGDSSLPASGGDGSMPAGGGG